MGYMSGDIDLAKDLSQEVFIKVWEALSTFRGDARISTWVYRIAANTCLMYIRKAKTEVKSSLELESINADADTKENESDIRKLYRAIGKLSEAERIIITFVLEEMPYSEISQVVGITENNLRVRIHRIKSKLSDLIKNDRL